MPSKITIYISDHLKPEVERLQKILRPAGKNDPRSGGVSSWFERAVLKELQEQEENMSDMGPLPRVHPRSVIVRQAELEFSQMLSKIVQKYNLTEIEIMRMLLAETQSWSKYILRKERHPDDPDKRGDEE